MRLWRFSIAGKDHSPHPPRSSPWAKAKPTTTIQKQTPPWVRTGPLGKPRLASQIGPF